MPFAPAIMMVLLVYATQRVKPTPPRDLLTSIAVLAVCAMATRDTFAATIRWILSVTNLTLLWYVVDVLIALGLILFLRTAVRARSVLPWFMLAILLIGLFTGSYFISSSALFLVSAAKMYLPLFLGWSFAGKDITADRPWFVRFMVALCVIAALGILISPYVTFPWQSFTIETFGVERKGGEVRWIDGQTRYAGFAGQNSLASMMVFMPLLIVYKRLKSSTISVLTIFCLAAAVVSTSRTAQIATILFGIWVLTERYLYRKTFNISIYRLSVGASLAFALMPIFLVAFASTVELSKIHSGLFSLQERIQLSWQYPFKYWYDAHPEANFFGCGAGCFTPPMMYTEKSVIHKAVDNFYIETIVMFGLFSLFQILIMISSPFKEMDRGKILTFALFNVIASIIDGYTIATLCFIAGYATSGSFTPDRDLEDPKRLAKPPRPKGGFNAINTQSGLLVR